MHMPTYLLFAAVFFIGCSDSKDTLGNGPLSRSAQALEAVTAIDLDPRPDARAH